MDLDLAREFLHAHHRAVLATSRSDGRPQLSPVLCAVDEKGRVLTYPAIQRLGSIPIAVIQSAGDKYVPAEESRRLFGPDTPTRRLYEVKASNHGFKGGQEELIQDLDASLAWISSQLSSGEKAP